MFILAQILSLIAMVINVVAVQLKTKKQILLAIVAANIFYVTSYILLGAYTGALTCVILIIVIIINTILENKGKTTPKILIGIYSIIYIIIGIATFNGLMDLLPIIASILFILTLAQSKEKYVRLCILGNSTLWIIYDLFVNAYVVGVSDTFVLLSTITAIYRYDIKKEVKENEANTSIESQ